MLIRDGSAHQDEERDADQGDYSRVFHFHTRNMHRLRVGGYGAKCPCPRNRRTPGNDEMSLGRDPPSPSAGSAVAGSGWALRLAGASALAGR